MTTTTLPDARAQEEGLARFLEPLDEGQALMLRSLAHAWTSGGGTLQPGQLATRLVAWQGEVQYTAATLHAPRNGQPPRLEIGHVVLRNHGLSDDQWTHWSDEILDIGHGFEATHRFPTIRLGTDFGPGEQARMVSALRDLAKLASNQTA